ncbi:uncharacterized protein LOC127732361 [Mytilus californianus]|uniref:uncharacterized protein LOC127732361 n=1 Tax=Mytilus californianus TaxID=6549 RepID=UPI002244FFD9|nr:uncharacterized protein LOC127732361 [Mytilus californianus]
MPRWIQVRNTPRRFEIVECSECSITIAWYINDQDDCMEYELDYRVQETDKWTVTTFSTKDVLAEKDGRRMYTLLKILPETGYEIKLCSIGYHVKSHYTESKAKQTLKRVLPEAINQLSEGDKIRYNTLMQSSKSEKRYFVRTMIVGKESVGKTCLLRRLLKEGISDVTSTDGVDIVVRRCKINIDDGTWIIGKDMDDDKVSRIKRALIPNAEDRDTKIMQVDETKNINRSQIDDMSTFKNDTSTDAEVSLDRNQSSSFVIPEDFTTDANVILERNEDKNESSSLVMSVDSATNANVNLNNYKEKKESSSLVMPDDLMANVFSKATVNTLSNLYALCELWDFAGQKEFYATHQAFLTSSAVYLVVADMKNDISKQGLSQCFADFQHIGEYVDFWFDSIHCHRTADERLSYGHFDPPIVLVFTGKDKYEKEADFKKREKELTDQMDKIFGLQSKYHHLHNTFYLSNTKDIDEVFEKLQYAVYETARKMDIWGNSFPLKWILLEHLIEINKNDGKNFINFTDMINLAKHPDINLLEKEDLLLFLRFQHNVGNIIFFENIPDLIILKPQWLADAFRCLVSDRVDNRRLYHLEDWTLFTRQGKISESLITELFESKDGSQFSGQKNNLHKVMERLDILVKIENSSYYIMPSMMPPSTFDVVCEKFGILTHTCKRTSWLCFKFEFLPPSFFNHISAWFIRNYYSSKVEGGIALYRGICMFDIDGSGGTKILVTMSTDTIALQLVSFSEEEGFVITCSDIYREVKQLIENIKERYKVKISFKLHFKCSDGYYFQDTFEYEKLTSEKECFCTQHKQMHQSDQIYSPWMNNEVKRIPVRANIGTKQDYHNPKNEPNKEEEFTRNQESVKTNLPVSVNLRKQLNIIKPKDEDLNINSCIKTGNTLVFVDFSQIRLIICNSDGTDIDHISLFYRPFYMTQIDSYTVAVSCIFDRTILIINIPTGSVTTREHIDAQAFLKLKEQARMKKVLEDKLSENEEAITSAMNVSYHLAVKDQPKSQFSATIDLLDYAGLDLSSKLCKAKNATDVSQASVTEYQSCIAESIMSYIVNDVNKSDFYFVMVDESTDRANNNPLL